MATVAQLRVLANEQGLTFTSKTCKAELERITTLVIIKKGDLRITRRLGADYLRGCSVAEWRHSGKFHSPIAWYVPQGVLDQLGVSPATEESRAADEVRLRVAREKRQAKAAERLAQAVETTGALADSRVAKEVASGRLDSDLGELIAFKTRYRHRYSDYDSLLEYGEEQEDARNLMTEDKIPEDWEVYLRKYLFVGPEAIALSNMLQEPGKCHPVWFQEAMIAIRRKGLDLDTLTYQIVAAAISEWRDTR